MLVHFTDIKIESLLGKARENWGHGVEKGQSLVRMLCMREPQDRMVPQFFHLGPQSQTNKMSVLDNKSTRADAHAKVV